MKNKIKSFLILGLITIMSCTTVFADTDAEATDTDKAVLSSYGESIIDFVKTMNDADIDYAIDNSYGTMTEAYETFKTMNDSVGAIESYEASSYEIDGDDYILTYSLSCEDGDGELEIIFNELTITSSYLTLTDAGVNVYPTTIVFSEKVKNSGANIGTAALNTLMGMGTVFTVLILILIIISLFVFINKIPELFNKKDKRKQEVSEAIDQTVARIEENENVTDDLQLIAVITAAIAAQTQSSPDSFVVRKIRRR